MSLILRGRALRVGEARAGLRVEREGQDMERLEALERLESRIRAFLAESEDARPFLEAALVRIVQRKDAALRLRYWEG